MTDEMAIPLIDKKKLDKKVKKKYSEDINEENEIDEKDKELIEIIKNNNYIISKIYFIFFIQLGISYLFIYQAFNNKLFFNIIKNNIKLFSLSICITAIIIYCSYQWKDFLVVVPFNYFFFFIFTICISFIICKIVILFSFKSITVLWILVLIMILSLSAYAYNSVKEIKIIEAVVFISLILISFGLILLLVAKIHLMDILLILFCLISFGVYLIYDINSIMKDKKIGKKNFILVNFYLYTDIFRIFIKMVKLMIKHLSKSLDQEENAILNDLNNVGEEVEKGFEDIKKNFGKNDDSDEDEDEDEGSDKKKKKEKDKKGKKEKSKKKEEKGKKDDKKKGKKEKEDKKDKGKKDKKKEDKKDSKKKSKKDKNQKSKKDDDDEDEKDDFLDNGKKVGEFFANIFSNN